jgi:hypothetical protein
MIYAIPSDCVFMELQLIGMGVSGPISDTPTYSGALYFSMYDTTGTKIHDYPLERGNTSLKGLGLNVRSAPTITSSVMILNYESDVTAGIYKLDLYSSSIDVISGVTDNDGCGISYVMGVVATNNFSKESLNSISIPYNVIPNYSILTVSVQKSLLSQVFNPYIDDNISTDSTANYISIGVHTVLPNLLSDGDTPIVSSNVSYYGISATDIVSLGSNDTNNYYVHFTSSATIYQSVMSYFNSSIDSLPGTCPVVNMNNQVGFLLYNKNPDIYQGTMLLRIRNGNYDVNPLSNYKSSTCYPTTASNEVIDDSSWLTISSYT